jgi:CheY-like chemotaxis protein
MVQEGKTILVVDDDLDFQFMVSRMLETDGFGVKYLIEGRLNSILKSARACDMILLDVDLPGMNGVDLSKTLKSIPDTKAIPIILVTGHSECDRLFNESKANAFFKKPFSFSALRLKITELLSPVYFRSPVEIE